MGDAVVLYDDVSELLELVEAAFDQIALPAFSLAAGDAAVAI